jgi:hypothetical protein
VQDTSLASNGAYAAFNVNDADNVMLWNSELQQYVVLWLVGDTGNTNSFTWRYDDPQSSYASEQTTLGDGLWYRRRLTNALVWTEQVPYSDAFPPQNERPLIEGVVFNEAGNEATLVIETYGAPNELLEVYYQDIGPSNAVSTTSGWSVAEVDIEAGGVSQTNWTDAGSAERPSVDDVFSRLYLVGRGDLDADEDGLPDAREQFVYSTQPDDADSDDDGMDDGWEVSYALDPTDASDATTDADGDGFSNEREYINRTDPQDANSKPGLVASYDFNEAVWTAGVYAVTDASGLDNHGIVHGGLQPTEDLFGRYARFDGVDDYIEVSNSPSLELDGDLTLEFWIKPESGSPTGYCINRKDGLGEFALKFVGNKRWMEYLHGTTYSVRWIGVVPNTMLNWDQWVHVVIVRDALERKVTTYVNGEWLREYDYVSDSAYQPSLSGRSLTLGEDFKGAFEQVRIYGCMLGTNEIASDYDADGDGMVNPWEEQNGLNPTNAADASLDADGDGFSNEREYINRTDPQDANSKPGLVAAYDFNESVWTAGVYAVTDASGQGNHGIVHGGLQPTEDLFGRYARFDGVDDYIEVSNSPSLMLDGDLTLEFWIKPESGSPTGYCINRRDGYGEFALRFIGDKRWLNYLHGNTRTIGWTAAVPDEELSWDKWLHVVLVRDALARKVTTYVNGEWLREYDYISDWEYQPGLSSRSLTLGEDFKGAFEQVRIYGHMRSTNEIIADYDADGDGMVNPWEEYHGLNPTNAADASLDADGDGFSNEREYINRTDPQDANSKPGLVASYDFNEAVWTAGVYAVTDASGQGNHGMVHGGLQPTEDLFGRYACFDGVDDYIEVSNSPSLMLDGDLTIGFWIKPEQGSPTGFCMNRRDGYGEFGLYFVGNKRRLDYYHGNTRTWGWVNAVPNGELTWDQWLYVVVVRDALERRVTTYVNGQWLREDDYSAELRYQPGLSGRSLTLGEDFKGAFEQVRIYGHMRSTNEIIADYDADGDGMVNPWEEYHGLNPTNAADATADADGDGISNYDEYLRGTSPSDALSRNIVLYVNAATGNNAYDGFASTITAGHGPKADIAGAVAILISGDIIEAAAGEYAENVLSVGTNTATLRTDGAVTLK